MQPTSHRLVPPEAPEKDAPEPSAGAVAWQRRRPVLVFAATILLLYPMDLLLVPAPSYPTLLTRLGWAAQMLLYAWLRRRVDGRWETVVLAVNSVLVSLFFLLLVYFTGGAESPYMNLVPSMPLMMALLQPQDTRPAILTGIASALGVMGLQWMEHHHPGHAVAWALMVGTATFFGVYGSTQFRKAQAAEDEARLERTRRESLEKAAVAERHRAQTEKLATVGRLAASVMHEINNPLAFVRSNLDFLRTEVLEQPLPEETRTELAEVFEETRTGVERIRQIVSDLKGFSRMDGEEPSECALADVVSDAARLAAMRLKHVARLKVEVPADLPEVFATRRRLAQVLLNLLVNAGDALEEAKVQGGEVRERGLAEEGRVVLLVEDNGPGFPPDVLQRLFEAFFTTKALDKGTGLGLSISRELVERFGGTLRAENRPEGGARLRLELPRHMPAAQAQGA
ncbi:sensor histidine kinase [Archangium sp.]|uniref:sensor histidine kinase n=1 Tax=Archangium sp. TaxID=1872627 RepID=UPI002EDAC589